MQNASTTLLLLSLRLLFPAALLVGSACSADHYRRDADREVTDIVDQKEESLFKKTTGFTIETARDALRSQMVAELADLRARRREELLKEVHAPEKAAEPVVDDVPPPEPPVPPEVPIGPEEPAEGSAKAQEALENAAKVQQQLETRLADVERRHAAELQPFEVTAPSLLPQRLLTLNDALQIASDNSRDYQTQKENVYLVALDLTFQRYLFDARFGVTSSYQWESRDGPGSTRQRDGTLTSQFSITQTLASGGVLVFDFTNSLIHRFTGIEFGNGTNHSTTSVADLTFNQPLLQGFGKDVVQEPLVQAERNVVYQLRDFERFRQGFAVTIAADYYNLLQQLDTIANARRSYLQFIDSREQSEALSERGRRSQIELDQATQSELQARNSWIVAQRSYQDQLDRFKITLGLPMDANLALDKAEFEKLRVAELPRVDVGDQQAIAVALIERLDHINRIEQYEDSERQVHVAADDLRAALDLNGGVAIPTADDSAFGFRGGQATWTAGATLDLPVDKLNERNSYRAALIRRDQEARNVSLSEDQVKEQVRDALRILAQLRETWRIAVESVKVAERRVQSTALTLRMGRIQIRDALDATTALNNARNQLTSALVDYEIARLELWRDMGLLALAEDGIRMPPPPAELTMIDAALDAEKGAEKAAGADVDDAENDKDKKNG